MRLSPVYLLTIPALLAAQPPAPEVKPTDPKNLAKLEGRTLHSVSGEPVRKVSLTLRRSPQSGTTGPMTGQPASAVSDAEGRFAFENVEPGTYMLFAERTGFLQQMYGSRSQPFSGTPITLSAGQYMKALEFKLTPQGVIAGKVVDEEGEPLPRAMISASRQTGGPQGRSGVGGMSSDDRGEFRVANLGPGKYFITAVYRQGMFGPAGGATPAPSTPGQPEEGYVPTHYPGVTDFASASTIEIGPGQEVSGIVIQMRKSRVYRIRGKVIGVPITEGMSRPNLQLMPRQMLSGMIGAFGGGGASIKPDGSFELTNVQPGSYNLVLMRFGEGRPQPLGRLPVDVTDAHVENVVIQAGEPVEITGVVRIEGVDKPEYRGSINLFAAESITMGTMGEIKQDGTFRITGVGRERYYINLFNLPEGTYLRSVKVGSQEARDLTVDLSGASAVTAIELTLSAKAATLEGLVKQADKPAPGMFVVAMPDPFRVEQRFLMKTGTSDQTGRFKLSGLAPGRYRVWAFEEPQAIGYNFDPAAFKPIEDKAVKIDAGEGSKEQVELTVVKFETR